MNENYENITIHQLDLMKHALGLDQAKAKAKRGKYTAYRNYFCSHGINEDWESLVKLGVAEENTGDPLTYPLSVFYNVSTEGMQLMERILGIKIVEGVN